MYRLIQNEQIALVLVQLTEVGLLIELVVYEVEATEVQVICTVIDLCEEDGIYIHIYIYYNFFFDGICEVMNLIFL